VCTHLVEDGNKRDGLSASLTTKGQKVQYILGGKQLNRGGMVVIEKAAQERSRIAAKLVG